MPADVTKPESVSHMLEATEDRFGGLDILVINAGGNYDHNRVEDGDSAGWLATLEVNLTGAYYCAREAIPYLKRRREGRSSPSALALATVGALEARPTRAPRPDCGC